MSRLKGWLGAVRLSTDAALGVIDLVEAVHARVQRTAWVPGWPALLMRAADRKAGRNPGHEPDPQRTRGLTGWVYRRVRGAAQWSGAGATGLVQLAELLSAPATTAVDTPALSPVLRPPRDPQHEPTREALLSALNGVLGDHLARSGNPLAVHMALHPREGLSRPTGHLLVMVHGLCMNDLQWSRDGHDHGQFLAEALDATPLYLRYNTGRAIEANGRDLAPLLHTLISTWPVPITRVTLLCHSMGGLVVRSALHHGRAQQQAWVKQVDEVVFLGTPHHGAPLERAGHWFEEALAQTPYASPFARLGKVRSQGIMDLRHGLAHPQPKGTAFLAVAGTVGEGRSSLPGRTLGDGLVPLASALGEHEDPQRHLRLGPDDIQLMEGINHMALLTDPSVAVGVLAWLDRRPTRRAPH